ncbi:MAG: metalloregulator ArsR/SmtB family transcription factor [Thermoplasmataceae archaeon]
MNTKEEIMLLLKRNGSMAINEISDRIGISKMAVLRQIEQLEEAGTVERRIIKGNVGRPFYKFSIKNVESAQLANSDSYMLQQLLAYLTDTGHEDILNDFLKERFKNTRIDYLKKLAGKDGDARIRELAKLRRNDNYYPEIRKINDGITELTEYNCPIFKIAEKNGFACQLEKVLFEEVLNMSVETRHRQVEGLGSCKFLIRKASH